MKAVLNQLASALTKRGETLAVAESVTSGNVQAMLSLSENATQFFQGGIVVYNLGQKTRQLDIDPIIALNNNCVSARIARDMALHVAQSFCADWGIAITGYAAPVPELKIKNLFAWYAIAHKGEVIIEKLITSKQMSVLKVQQFYAGHLLNALVKVV